MWNEGLISNFLDKMSGFGFLEEVSTDDQTEQPTNDMVFIFIIEKLYSVYKLYLKKIRNPLNFNTIYKQNYTGVDLPKAQFVSSYMTFIGHASDTDSYSEPSPRRGGSR